ncbi:hypothetical protein CP970_30555 [Streptomyces kanamyceticus]|uniref:Uncharacterized protein n=1 Tax=Streptomyces kanamyceticus TaxID=1967 RepID=A0A5J6GNQ3_STRKN|nr:hypothetical protein CP970_30555 [Streptomyces kanamyceticus]
MAGGGSSRGLSGDSALGSVGVTSSGLRPGPRSSSAGGAEFCARVPPEGGRHILGAPPRTPLLKRRRG